jgi:hypothetical protein
LSELLQKAVNCQGERPRGLRPAALHGRGGLARFNPGRVVGESIPPGGWGPEGVHVHVHDHVSRLITSEILKNR